MIGCGRAWIAILLFWSTACTINGGPGGSGGACTGDGDDCQAGTGGPGGPGIAVQEVKYAGYCCVDGRKMCGGGLAIEGSACYCATMYGPMYGSACR
jgi:hypothetical protein